MDATRIQSVHKVRAWPRMPSALRNSPLEEFHYLWLWGLLDLFLAILLWQWLLHTCLVAVLECCGINSLEQMKQEKGNNLTRQSDFISWILVVALLIGSLPCLIGRQRVSGNGRNGQMRAWTWTQAWTGMHHLKALATVLWVLWMLKDEGSVSFIVYSCAESDTADALRLRCFTNHRE